MAQANVLETLPWRAFKLYIALMFGVTTRLRFIEPQLASPVDQPPEGKHWIHELKHVAIAAKCCLSQGKRGSSPAMDTIGATAPKAQGSLVKEH